MLSKEQWIDRAKGLAHRTGKTVALYMSVTGPRIDVASPTLEPFVMVTPEGEALEVKQKWKS